jgi:hypothetical protein
LFTTRAGLRHDRRRHRTRQNRPGLYALLYDIIAGRRDYRRVTRELFHYWLLGKMSALALRRVLRPVE